MMKEIDFTKQAADFLRVEATRIGLTVRSSHSHMLVAASLGYNSRKALLDDSDGPSEWSQWLGRSPAHDDKVREALLRMENAPAPATAAREIAEIIRDGLTPGCCECGIHSRSSVPLGDVHPGDEAEWVCSGCRRDPEEFGHCRCCGDGVFYRLSDLDRKGLCSEHEGEFDLDPEEAEGWASYVENVTKDA